MNKNTGIIVGIIVLLIVVGGIYTSMNTKDDAMMINNEMEQKAIEEKAMMEKRAAEEKEAMMKDGTTKTETMADGEGVTAMSAGSYETYSPEKVALASSEHDVVLFFRASWCPSCQGVDKDIKANASKIPASLSILDVNYDDSTALKQKYGVTYQHTFVQVDKDGTMIKKWSGSPTLSALIAEVK